MASGAHREMEFDDTVGTTNPVSDVGGGRQCETPVEVCWDNIVYTVQVVDEEKKPGLPFLPTPTKSKTILNGCSGILKPGTFAAIIGPSGCGKTSLLCALAGKLRGGELTGQVRGYFLVFVQLFEKYGTLIERYTALIEKVSAL
eukprot:SAG31_NODE_4300_length_3371_cov_8.759780_1_plen_143_part_10